MKLTYFSSNKICLSNKNNIVIVAITFFIKEEKSVRKRIKKQRLFSGLLLILLIFIVTNSAFAASDKPLLKIGMSGSSVEQLQRNLKELGFFYSKPTAIFGDITKEAVINFQKYYGLKQDGIVGFSTFSEIECLLDKTYKWTSSTQIVIDPGHGGIDEGTSRNGIIEKSINLEISKKLQHYLMQRGYESVLTRNTDKSLYELSNLGDTIEERDLNARIRIINRNNAKLFVSIHVNSNPLNTALEGPIVYYGQKIPQSRKLADGIQRELNVLMNNQKQVSNKPELENFYVLKFSNIPGVLVETAFVTNKNDRILLGTETFKEKTAQAIAKGIENSGLLD